LAEAKFGIRDKKGYYIPKKRVGYPPVFVWPPKPMAAAKWIVSIPGYFLPWNIFYVVVGLISWFCLSPTLDAFAKPTFSLFVLLFLRNSVLVLVFFGTFHYRLYIQRTQGSEYKFNPRWPSENAKQFLFGNQNLDNIFLTFASGVIVWTVLEVGVLWFAANNFVSVIKIEEHVLYFVTMILMIHFWRDLHFYLVHRLIHWAPLYRLAHHVHHKNTNPGPWSGLAMHPLEHLLYFSCALLYLFFPFHPAFVVITLVHAGLSPAPGHAGFERIQKENGDSCDIDGYAHYLHHKYFECNYADGILPLDRWFGTFHDGSEQSKTRLKNRLKQKSLKKIQ
jgi:sterol desaturase/sphingolipid hydroxylase (fatty acid hydroxylase superfamily)